MNMNTRSKRARQRAWLGAFEASMFNISAACNKVRIDRSTYYKWLTNDPAFAQGVQDAREAKIDFIEDQLLERISSGDTTAIIFALKTQAKHRGYVERQEVVGPVTTALPPLDIKILLQNPEIRLALETISERLIDGPKDPNNT